MTQPDRARPPLHCLRLYDALSKDVLFSGEVHLIEGKAERGSVFHTANGKVIIARRQQKSSEVECRAYVYPHPYAAAGVTADHGAAMVLILASLRGTPIDEESGRDLWYLADAFTRDRIATFATLYGAEKAPVQPTGISDSEISPGRPSP